jgi:hypothetical protein
MIKSFQASFLGFGNLGLRICFEIRISCFGFHFLVALGLLQGRAPRAPTFRIRPALHRLQGSPEPCVAQGAIRFPISNSALALREVLFSLLGKLLEFFLFKETRICIDKRRKKFLSC